jgi:hypothetical protein
LAASLREEEVALGLGLGRGDQLLEELALPLQALVERQINCRFNCFDAVLGRAEAAGLARHRLAELREDLGLAAHRADLVVEIADLPERPLLGHDLLREGHPGRGEIAVHDLVDQADLQRLVRPDRIAAHDHGQRLGHPDHARQPLGAARARQDAELHLGQAEARGLHAHAVVAGQRHLEPAAQRGAVDRGHHRLGRALDQIEHLVQPGLLRRFAEFGDVGARNKGAPRARDHDRRDARIGRGLLEAIPQTLAHVLAERVDGRIVDGEHGHAAAAIEINGLTDGCHGLLLRRWAVKCRHDTRSNLVSTRLSCLLGAGLVRRCERVGAGPPKVQ